MPNYITSLKLFKHLSRDMLNDTKYDWPLYSERVCLSHKSRPSKSRFFLQSAESIRGYNIFLRFSMENSYRTPLLSIPASHTQSHVRARTQGYFYNRFLHALFAVYVALIFMAVKGERVIATAKQPVDFIACVRFLPRLSRSQTKHLMHYSMLHLLTEKSQIIPFKANQVLLESNKEES